MADYSSVCLSWRSVAPETTVFLNKACPANVTFICLLRDREIIEAGLKSSGTGWLLVPARYSSRSAGTRLSGKSPCFSRTENSHYFTHLPCPSSFPFQLNAFGPPILGSAGILGSLLVAIHWRAFIYSIATAGNCKHRSVKELRFQTL